MDLTNRMEQKGKKTEKIKENGSAALEKEQTHTSNKDKKKEEKRKGKERKRNETKRTRSGEHIN